MTTQAEQNVSAIRRVVIADYEEWHDDCCGWGAPTRAEIIKHLTSFFSESTILDYAYVTLKGTKTDIDRALAIRANYLLHAKWHEPDFTDDKCRSIAEDQRFSSAIWWLNNQCDLSKSLARTEEIKYAKLIGSEKDVASARYSRAFTLQQLGNANLAKSIAENPQLSNAKWWCANFCNLPTALTQHEEII